MNYKCRPKLISTDDNSWKRPSLPITSNVSQSAMYGSGQDKAEVTEIDRNSPNSISF